MHVLIVMRCLIIIQIIKYVFILISGVISIYHIYIRTISFIIYRVDNKYGINYMFLNKYIYFNYSYQYSIFIVSPVTFILIFTQYTYIRVHKLDVSIIYNHQIKLYKYHTLICNHASM